VLAAGVPLVDGLDAFGLAALLAFGFRVSFVDFCCPFAIVILLIEPLIPLNQSESRSDCIRTAALSPCYSAWVSDAGNPS